MQPDDERDVRTATQPKRRTLGLLARLYGWACRRIYYEFAWGYDFVSWIVSCGHWSRWRRFAIDAIEAKGSDTDGRILEIGFGTGVLLAEWTLRQQSDPSRRIYGLELSAPMHRVAAAKLAQQQISVPCIQASAEEIPLADGTIQTIVSTFPAAYIFSPQTLGECVRVLCSTSEGSEEAVAESAISSPRSTMMQKGGHLLIVGAWVLLDVPWLRRLNLPFYGEPEAAVVAEIVARMERAGFRVELRVECDGIFGVSVIEGVKRC